ncbi:hypothetical protein Hte_006016 [Hypoxylon texense]
MDLYSRKVAAFADTLAPYFDVVGVFVQVKPDVMGILWGSILLIFKIGSNYSGFFEKVSQMLETISTSLPQYREALSICQSRKFTTQDRLVKSLSFVYADIFEFCRQLIVMLNHGSRGAKWQHRVGFLGDVIWRPFDDRFRQLLDRLRRHKAVFEQELRIQDQKMLNEVHRSQLRLDMLYENIQKALDDAFKEVGQSPDPVTMEQFKKSLERQTSDLKRWIQAPDYMSIYEHAKHNKLYGSGQWFLSMNNYQAWRNSADLRPTENACDSSRDRRPSTAERVLLVQAKPGFGKTYLSTIIIDDLESYVPLSTTEKDQRGNTPLVVFFHFSRDSNLGGSTAIDAWKAIAAQMIHHYRDEPAILDSAALFIASDSSGQLNASYNDTFAVLSLLARVQPVFFIIDGVDECKDYEIFLTTLTGLCQDSDCWCILLSRPDINLPRSLSHLKPHICSLNEKDNYDDIKLHLSQEISTMVEDGLFGNRPLPDNSIQRAATQSSGVFLWARLLTAFMSNAALTPRERRQFLINALLFEGLDGLCISILSQLDQRSTHEKKLALKIFQWIAAALYPLSTATFHTALAIVPGEETSDMNYLIDFPECLPKLTGALVDINAFGRPTFIHLSVREFLVSQRSASVPNFSLQHPGLVHTEIAISCLSYLSHDIPKRPLRPLSPMPIEFLALSTAYIGFQGAIIVLRL